MGWKVPYPEAPQMEYVFRSKVFFRTVHYHLTNRETQRQGEGQAAQRNHDPQDREPGGEAQSPIPEGRCEGGEDLLHKGIWGCQDLCHPEEAWQQSVLQAHEALHSQFRSHGGLKRLIS